MSAAQLTPGPLFAHKIEDRSAYNIFAPGYCTAIATVSSQSNAEGCMGSIVTQQYALAMAAAPDLLAVVHDCLPTLRREYVELAQKYAGTRFESDRAYQEVKARYLNARAAIAKATGGTS